MRYILLLLLSFSAFAELDVTEKTSSYPVIADSVTDLKAALDAASPAKKDDKVVHANTAYEIDYQFRFSSRSRVCEVNKVTTTLDLQYTLPKLDSQNDEVKKVWSKWFPNLAQYQHQKGELVRAAAQSLDDQLSHMPEVGKCQKLKSQADELAAKVKNELATQLRLLDQKTEFGRTEHAWLNDHLQ
ncbi:DUF922 domain-containing protein [Pseudoalteromonas sp. GB56]